MIARIAVCFFALAATSLAQERIWNDWTMRHSTKGTLIGVRTVDVVIVKSSGEIIVVPKNRLSAVDRKYVEAWKPPTPPPFLEVPPRGKPWNPPKLIVAPAPSENTIRNFISPISKYEYDHIDLGFTLAQVEDRIGQGEESGRNKIGNVETVGYVWKDDKGGMIFLIFSNDKLLSKSQGGLK